MLMFMRAGHRKVLWQPCRPQANMLRAQINKVALSEKPTQLGQVRDSGLTVDPFIGNQRRGALAWSWYH